MAQNQTLPLGSGLGAIRAPSLQGDANEAAFRKDAASGGLMGEFLRGIGFQSDPANQEAIAKALSASPELSTRMKNIYPNNEIFNSASGGIGLSQVPASGLPDILPSETNLFGDDSDGFKIQTKRGPETISEFAASNLDGFYEMFKPTPEDARRLARARGQVIPGVADEIEAMSIRDASDARTRGGSFGSTVDDAAGQLAGGQETSRILAEAQAGKTFEDKSVSTGTGLPQELTTGELSGGAKVKGADTPAKQAAVTALDEYLKAARPGVAPKDYAEYIKEFGEATGLDVSGEPDNKTALMAFGLALMQNKAGKGFDVGKMLSSVGEAGEKALPAMEAARKEAMAMRAKAGEYAISRKKEDKAAAMNRKGYYIIPAGASNSASGFLQAVQSGKGRLERLNDYELNSLDQNSEFNQQYDIIPADRYESVVSEVIKAANKGKDIKSYLETPKTISLFGSDEEVPDWARVDVFYGNPNSNNKGNNVLAESPEAVLQRITSAQNGLLKEEKKFVKIADLLNKTDIDRLSQVGYSVVQFGRDFGINVTEQGTPLEQLKYLLKTIEVSETANILGEAGKTLSDVDRQLVRDIVGKIDWDNADAGLLKDKLREIYGLVITKGKENIANSFKTLKKYGVQVDSGQTTSANSGGWTEGEDGVFRKASKQG